jgi:hypothetical protein
MATLANAQEVGELLERIEGLKKKAPEGQRPVTQTHVPEKARNAGITDQSKPAPAAMSQEDLDRPPLAPLIAEGTVRERWPGFISELKEKRIALGMALDGTSVLAVQGHLIKVGCPDEFTTSSIKRYKQELQDSLQRLLNTRVQIEPVMDQSLKLPNAGERAQPSTAGKTSVEEHPVVKAMIRELGAEPL